MKKDGISSSLRVFLRTGYASRMCCADRKRAGACSCEKQGEVSGMYGRLPTVEGSRG